MDLVVDLAGPRGGPCRTSQDLVGPCVIGRLLAAETFELAREHNYVKIVVQVLATNTRALAFYRGLGFEDIGVARRHVVLGGQFVDEVFLEKFLA